MRNFGLYLAAAALLVSGCASNEPASNAPAAPVAAPEATADLRTADGTSIGQARVTQVGDSLRLEVRANNMRAGSFGAHIHSVGRCDAPDFTTAGPHWNPTGQQHGKNNPQGMHKGDLPNLLVGTDRRGSFEITVPAAFLSGGASPLMDGDGAALVVHERADDFRTDPSGNSGARIACGVFSSATS